MKKPWQGYGAGRAREIDYPPSILLRLVSSVHSSGRRSMVPLAEAEDSREPVSPLAVDIPVVYAMRM